MSVQAPVHSRTTHHWQRELATAVRSGMELRRRLRLPHSDSDSSATPAAESDFPVLVTESYLQRMRPGDPQDPLLLQVLPQHSETQQQPGFRADPVGDLQAELTPGVLQKYYGRALLVTTGACAIHCRYCFRRSFPYADLPVSAEQWQQALRAIQEDTTISEIILSGGDPLLLTDGRLRNLVTQLEQIPHLDRLRIHTRLPIVLPSRITTELLDLLQQSRLQSIMVIHANHAAELAGDCRDAIQRLLRSGIPVLNQTVLLRHINDDADTLEQLSLSLINLGVMPYYLHQLDRVHGAAHFEVPEQQGRQLIEELTARLPGYAVPRYVQEIPGETSKTRISP